MVDIETDCTVLRECEFRKYDITDRFHLRYTPDQESLESLQNLSHFEAEGWGRAFKPSCSKRVP